MTSATDWVTPFVSDQNIQVRERLFHHGRALGNILIDEFPLDPPTSKDIPATAPTAGRINAIKGLANQVAAIYVILGRCRTDGDGVAICRRRPIVPILTRSALRLWPGRLDDCLAFAFAF